jgi:hypothetical protein
MLKCTKLLGTAGVLGIAALVASPAAAGTLTDMAATVQTEYSAVNVDDSGSDDDTTSNWLLGGSVAAPLSDLANLNIQANVSYRHSWRDEFSRETWNFGADPFWAGADGRIGIDFTYVTFTHFGHITNGGLFGEWYFGNITAMAKGGWVSTGGSAFGGHGTYLGGAVEGYVMPDLGITGGVTWAQDITGQGCQICGRTGVNTTVWEIGAEFLFSEDFGVSGYAGYAHNQVSVQGNDDNSNIWRVGLRWYVGGGSLVDHHRNGTLNPWLPGLNTGD